MFFTEQERAIMLEEARRKYGNRDVITLEEYIAEDFREFMLMGAKDNRSFGRKFIDLLKRLANMVQNYHLFQPSSTYYFNAINKGKFKNAVPKRVHVSRRMTTRQQLDEALNEFESIYSDDPAVQRECEEIKAKAIANGTFMKAPNGKQSKLDERQWLHVRTKAFKEWFGDWERLAELENLLNSEKNSTPSQSIESLQKEYDELKGKVSKVVDENGEPLVVYHGTRIKDLSKFNVYHKDQEVGDMYGAYFTKKKKYAQTYGPNVYEVFLNIKSPVFTEGPHTGVIEKRVKDKLDNRGIDGIVNDRYDNDWVSKLFHKTRSEIIVFDSNQIKSATDNNGQYSRENDNILGYYLDRLSNRAFERAFINLATILEGLGARGKAFLHLVESNKSFKSFKEIVDFLNGKGLNVEYLDMFKKVDESLSEKEFKELMQELRDSQNKTEQENIDYGKKNIEELGFEDGKTYSYEEVLEKIEINGAAKIIWDIIEPIVKKLGLKITFDASDTRRNGYFVPRDGRVVITGYGAKSHIGETFVHELVHAVTTKIIDAVNSGNTEGLTQKQIDAVKGLQKLYEKTKKESGNSDAYRNSNIFEYVAHLSNEQHKRELETYEKSFLEKFVDFILDILGIKNSYDLAKQYLRDIIDDGSYLVNNGITTIGDILESKRRRDITNSDLLPTEVKAIQEYIESILKDKKIKQPNKAFYLVSNGNLYKFNSSLKQYKANRKKDRHGFEIISAWSLEGLSDSIIEELEDVIRAGKNVDFFINKQGGEYEVGDSLGSYLGFGDQGTTSGNDRLDNGTLQGEPYRGTSGQQDSRNSISIRTMRNTKGEVISMAQYRALNNLPAPNSFATLTDQQQQAVEEYGLSEEDYDGLTEQAKEYLKHCLL